MACACNNNINKQKQNNPNDLMSYKLIMDTGTRAATNLRSVRELTDVILKTTSAMLIGVVDERIFDRNLLTNGSQIKGGAGYSTKAALVNISDYKLSLGAVGALASLTNVKPKQGQTYFFASYSQIRQAAGLQTDHIDLQFTNKMRDDLILYPNISENTYGIGFATQGSADIMSYNEKRFGIIMQLSQQEIIFLVEKIQLKVSNLLNK